MNTLIPHDKLFQNLFQFHRDFDRLFGDMMNRGRVDGSGTSSSSNFIIPAIESYIDRVSRKFCCTVALPGLKPDDVKINVQGNVLTINGERNIDVPEKEVDWLNSEIWYGAFERAITLPEGVDTSTMTAEYRNGMLQITAPLSASALPRRIEIQSDRSKRLLASQA